MEAHKLRREQARQASKQQKESLPHSLKQSMDLAQEKSASSWLTSLPIEEFDYSLHKGAFHTHSINMWMWCQVLCRTSSILSKRCFSSIRHNEIGDLTANFLTEVCNDVCIEPDLQPMTGEALTGTTSNAQDGAQILLPMATVSSSQSSCPFQTTIQPLLLLPQSCFIEEACL